MRSLCLITRKCILAWAPCSRPGLIKQLPHCTYWLQNEVPKFQDAADTEKSILLQTDGWNKKRNLISRGKGLMTESCWLQFSFLNEMVNTSFQAARLLISPRATTTSHSNLYRLPPLLLRPWSDKADHEVNRVFPSHSIVTAFFFAFFLLFLSQPLQNETADETRAVTLGHAISALMLETSGRSFWCSCRCLQYLWILDWTGHEKMAPVERFINREPKPGGGGRDFWVAASVTRSLSMWLTGHGWSRTNKLLTSWRSESARHTQHRKDATSLTAGCISHSAV